MKSLSLKRGLFILLLIIVTLSGIIIATIIVPFSRQILSLEDEINRTRATLEQQFKDARYIRRSVRELPAVKEKMKEFERATIVQGEELSLVSELEQLAEKYRITQTLSVTFVDPSKARGRIIDKTKRYEFSFTHSGQYNDQILFLKALEEHPVYFLINNVALENAGGTAATKGLTIMRFNATVRIRE